MEIEHESTKVSRNRRTYLKHLWGVQKCEQLLTHEAELEEKDLEIARLRVRVEELTCIMRHEDRGITAQPESKRASGHDHYPTRSSSAQSNDQHGLSRGRRGKAPPMEYFTGESPEVTMEEWPREEQQSGMSGLLMKH